MTTTRTCTWTSRSGVGYAHIVCPINGNFPNDPGNYILAKETPSSGQHPFHLVPLGPPDAGSPPEKPRPASPSDVTVPAVPPAHFVLVQTHLAFGLLEALLDGPPGSGHPHQFLQSGTGRAEAHVVGQLPGFGDAAPGQQPVALARFLQGPYLRPNPVVDPGGLGAIARA